MRLQVFISFLLLLWLSGCNGLSDEQADDHQLPPETVIPKNEPLSKTGNHPYVVDGVLYTPLNHLDNFRQSGVASWYGKKFHGKKTSSGEIYNMYQLSAAHKTLPIPSYITVTNLKNNKSLVVRVNDRGPFIGDRILDLSYAAAKELEFVTTGTTQISIESITKIDRVQTSAQSQNLVYLQTGVYAEQGNALNAKDKLETQGYQVKVETTDELLYKVIVGPFTTAQLAYNNKLDLERELHQPVLLITESQ